jgi:hypothetical protein
MTDVHVHLAALPTAENGCHLSARMRRSFLFRWLARRLGLWGGDAAAANRQYVERLESELAASRHVRRAVLLALDGVYDERGELARDRTDFMISNDYLFEATRGRERLLAGASINPRRRDALEELERCAARGAVLVKVLPNVQGFDPADRRFKDFYRALARLKLPLLSHVGWEFTLFAAEQSFGDPRRLALPLEEGVTVIAAHGCSAGLVTYGRNRAVLLEWAKRFPNFYVDTSALTLPSRVGALFQLAALGELADRLLFGTDYPLPVLCYPCLGAGAIRAYARARRNRNPFDRQWEVLRAVGLPPERDLPAIVG